MLCVASERRTPRPRPPVPTRRPATGTAPERGGQICGAGGGEESDAMCLHSTLRLSLPNWSPSVSPKARQPVPEATAATSPRLRSGCAGRRPGFRSRPRQPAVHSSPYAPLLPVRSLGRKRRRRRRMTRARDSAGSTQHRSGTTCRTIQHMYTRHKSRTPHDSRLRSGCDARRYASPCVYHLVH